jgi:protein TonB
LSDPSDQGSHRAGDALAWLAAVGGILLLAAGVAYLASNVRVELRPAVAPAEAEPADEETAPASPAVAPLPDRPARPSDGSVIEAPAWLRRPEPDFPRRAIRNGVEEGAVVLVCTVSLRGRLRACQAVSETPEGYGFAREALEASEEARLSPYRVDGVPQPTQIRFTVRYQWAD